ncbi:hypothetical protein GEV33_001717 [Tenebrio molitor]|uniref:Retropepsins domain-containing protein n=1 Tax=Tenebrio molitor TaxID=7067 RepID=A0A8J6HUS3_TENMO|nr:hypothetical protein GEV33_001717 [Tenebrio molitor]
MPPTQESTPSVAVPISVPVPSVPVLTQVPASSAPVLTPERSSRPVRVQDWRVTFNGKGDPVAFLERVEKLCESDGVNAYQLLPHLPGLLQATSLKTFTIDLDGERVQSPPTAPNDWPLLEESDHRPHVTVQILGESNAALVDTGVAGSFIGDYPRDKCYRHLRPASPTIQSASRMANGQVDVITEAYWISLKMGTTTIQGKFHHLPHLPSDIVLGIDILRRYPFTIDLEESSASLRSPAAGDATRRLAFGSSSRKNFSSVTPDTIRGLTPLAQHEIRLPHLEPGIIDVDRMLAEGVIEPSDSPWSSPIVLAKKKFSFKSWFRRPGRTPFILVSQRSLVLKFEVPPLSQEGMDVQLAVLTFIAAALEGRSAAVKPGSPHKKKARRPVRLHREQEPLKRNFDIHTQFSVETIRCLRKNHSARRHVFKV